MRFGLHARISFYWNCYFRMPRELLSLVIEFEWCCRMLMTFYGGLLYYVLSFVSLFCMLIRCYVYLMEISLNCFTSSAQCRVYCGCVFFFYRYRYCCSTIVCLVFFTYRVLGVYLFCWILDACWLRNFYITSRSIIWNWLFGEVN
jgi:hypothetical protein